MIIAAGGGLSMAETGDVVKLPQPRFSGAVSVEKALHERRSVREFKNDPLTLDEVSQLLWAAQGITDDSGHRTAPSGGALYPLELYVVAGNVTGLSAGIYRYNPRGHELVMVIKGDKRGNLSSAALEQPSVKNAPAVFVFSVVYERITIKYGERGKRYAMIEVGHAGQNIYLEAGALGLGTVAVGAFRDEDVKKVLEMADDEQPLYLMPVGRK
ncbi:SagB/ThcOx family dehydrogenase [bacterium]|nr:SagB/ThcOx family dehydrogenase [bacterium]